MWTVKEKPQDRRMVKLFPFYIACVFLLFHRKANIQNEMNETGVVLV